MEYSIVMPCLYRNKDNKGIIQECIDSVIENTDWSVSEFIIYDDGSPLGTSFLRKSADVYVRNKRTSGIAVGWNTGMKLARGKYIIIINDDIVAVPGWIKAMRNALDTFPNSLVSAPRVEKMPHYEDQPREIRKWFPGSCFMLRREAIDVVGYFDEQFVPFNYEDVDYWTRVYQSGHTLSRDYSVMVGHKEGSVIHKIKENGSINDENRKRYLRKWGFDPIPVFYEGNQKLPWE